MAVKEVVIKYVADTSALRPTEAEIRRIAKAAGASEDQVRAIAKEFENVGGNAKNSRKEVDQFETALNRVGKKIAAVFATKKISEFITRSVNLAVVMEQNRIAFTNFTGSVENANKLLSDLEKFGSVTPYNVDELTSATRQLMAFGVTQEDVLGTLETLGNIASGTGTDLKDFAFVFGQVKTQGTAYTQDLNQFASRGIPIFKELAKVLTETGQFGVVSSQDVKSFAADGVISFELIEKALQNMTAEGALFNGMMQKQSETTGGKISTLQDNFDALSRKLGEALLPAINNIVDGLNWLIGTTESATNASIEEANALRVQQQRLNALVPLLQANTENEASRKAIIDQINDVSPEFLQNLDLESASYEEIEARLTEVNKAMEDQIRLLLARGEMEVLQEQFADTTREMAEFQATLIRIQTDGKYAGETFGELGRRLNEATQGAGSTEERLRRINEVVGTATEEFEKAGGPLGEFGLNVAGLINQFDKYGQGINSIDPLTQALTESSRRYDEILKQVGGDQEKNTEGTQKAGKAAKKASEEVRAAAGSYTALKNEASKLRAEIDALNDGTAEQTALIEKLRVVDDQLLILEARRKDVEVERVQSLEALKTTIPDITARTEEWIDTFGRLEEENPFNPDKWRFEDYAAEAANALGAVDGLFSAINQRQIRELEETEARKLKNFRGTAAQREVIEERFAKKREEIEKKQNERAKAFALIQATIQTAINVTKALGTGLVVPNIPAGALAGALGAIQIATIAAQKFARGKIGIKGPGGPMDDRIPALLSAGESVIPALETKQYEPTLRAIMERKIDPKLLNAMVEGRGPESPRGSRFDDTRIVRELRKNNRYARRMLFGEERNIFNK